jgi:hypothetical protein
LLYGAKLCKNLGLFAIKKRDDPEKGYPVTKKP